MSFFRRGSTSSEPDGRSPPHVGREFRQYLTCGLLAHGFARARCADGGHDFLVAFCCKGRGICSACSTRRMAETGAPLVDHGFPEVPVRQWVLSLPKRLRSFLHRQAHLVNPVLSIFLAEVEAALRAWSAHAHRAERGEATELMLGWDHSGGFSPNADVWVASRDRAGLQRLLRYGARPIFAGGLAWVEPDVRLIYHLPKLRPDGQTDLYLEFPDRLAARVPPPRTSAGAATTGRILPSQWAPAPIEIPILCSHRRCGRWGRGAPALRVSAPQAASRSGRRSLRSTLSVANDSPA